MMSQTDEQQEIRQVFRTSWVYAARFFANFIILQGHQIFTPLYKFIIHTEYIKGGYYTEQIHAGYAVSSLILSRSRHYGLRPEQTLLSIDCLEGGKFILVLRDQMTRTETVVDHLLENDIKLEPLVQAMFDRLLEYPID